jgi:signal transduction histidine kinase
MNTSLFIVLTTNIINIGLLFFVINKKNNNIGSTLERVFVGSLFSLIVWSSCNYFADTSTTLASGLFWTRASFPAALYMCLSIFYFSCIFPIQKKSCRPQVIFYIIIVTLFSLLSMGSFVIRSITLDPTIGVANVDVGSLYTFVVITYLALIIHATYNFISNYRNLSGKPKVQTKYVLIGWSTFLTFAVITNAVLPLITGNANWSKFGPLGSVVMTFSITYAIVRHQFLDLKIIIQRGLIYSILLSIIITTYLALIFTFEHLFTKSNETAFLISALVTTCVGIFGVPPLKKYFQKVTDRFFFKDSYNYAEVLSRLTDVLNKNVSLEAITSKSTEILKNNLKIETVTIVLKNDKKINTDGVHFLEIKSNKKNIGQLILGEKRSGDPYTPEDTHLLETFTKLAGTALEKASLYKQVQEYAKTLEKRVEERTQEVVAIQKEQETLMLEISHGLQTPLTIMKGELFFLRKQGHDTTRVDTIDTSIDRISTFILRFLSLSRLETTLVNKKEILNLKDLLNNVVLFFDQETKSKNIQLTATIEKNVFVEGNKDELEELFSNLVSNSIKYMKKDGKRSIQISLSEDTSNASIALTDTGIGIRDENLPNLFKKFYRVKESETKGITGTGLGLVICKKIVDIHGGTISVTSTFGEGTTFKITLPVAQ